MFSIRLYFFFTKLILSFNLRMTHTRRLKTQRQPFIILIHIRIDWCRCIERGHGCSDSSQIQALMRTNVFNLEENRGYFLVILGEILYNILTSHNSTWSGFKTNRLNRGVHSTAAILGTKLGRGDKNASYYVGLFQLNNRHFSRWADNTVKRWFLISVFLLLNKNGRFVHHRVNIYLLWNFAMETYNILLHIMH